jgi:hypothetical protein
MIDAPAGAYFVEMCVRGDGQGYGVEILYDPPPGP